MTAIKAWMPIYWGDYLRDTAHLSTAEHGAYLLLIGHYWVTAKPLPDDEEKLRRIARMDRDEWVSSRETISAFFVIADGLWVHQRVEIELAGWSKRKEVHSERASAAAKTRWDKHRNAQSNASSNASSNAPSMPQAMLEQCPSPSPSPSSLRSDLGGGGGAHEPAGAMPSDGTDAATATTKFLTLRAELWPNECNFPAPTMTLQTQAAELLKQAPLSLVLEIMERGMRSAAAQGKPASHSFKAFHRSMASASINHQNAATVADGGNSNGFQSRPVQQSRIADVETRRRRTAESVRRVMEPGGPGS